MNKRKLDSVNLKQFNRIVWIFCVVILCACTSKETGQSKKESDTTGMEISSKGFEMVVPPTLLVTPEERADYLVRHYWGRFNFTDTTFLHRPEISEQAFANYIDLFSHTRIETVKYSIAHTLDQSRQEPKMHEYFTELFKKYLYDSNSPLRNEEYYTFVVEYLLESGNLDEAGKARLQFTREMIRKNQVGREGTDFSYKSASGKTGRMHAIQSPALLLLFYNPDCHSCAETVHFLKNSSLINELVLAQKLTILAVYPDEDLERWKAHLPELPDTWMKVYDHPRILVDKNLYDLRAIPTLYLLDENKIVLLKDPTLPQFEAYLWQNINRFR